MSSERTLAAAVMLALLAGCPTGGSSGGGECNFDAECATGDVCARDLTCNPRDRVREVVTRWTVGGQPASADTCATQPRLAIQFVGPGVDDVLGYAPVPCAIGQYVIDKLPDRFAEVALGPEGGFPMSAAIPASNVVALDLR